MGRDVFVAPAFGMTWAVRRSRALFCCTALSFFSSWSSQRSDWGQAVASGVFPTGLVLLNNFVFRLKASFGGIPIPHTRMDQNGVCLEQASIFAIAALRRQLPVFPVFFFQVVTTPYSVALEAASRRRSAIEVCSTAALSGTPWTLSKAATTCLLNSRRTASILKFVLVG